MTASLLFVLCAAVLLAALPAAAQFGDNCGALIGCHACESQPSCQFCARKGCVSVFDHSCSLDERDPECCSAFVDIASCNAQIGCEYCQSECKKFGECVKHNVETTITGVGIALAVIGGLVVLAMIVCCICVVQQNRSSPAVVRQGYIVNNNGQQQYVVGGQQRSYGATSAYPGSVTPAQMSYGSAQQGMRPQHQQNGVPPPFHGGQQQQYQPQQQQQYRPAPVAPISPVAPHPPAMGVSHKPPTQPSFNPELNN